MSQLRSVAIALLALCAAAPASAGQQGQRSAPRDSATRLPRVNVTAPNEMRSPDHAALQRRREAMRDSLLGELAAARTRWKSHAADRVTYRLTERCFCAATWELPKYATVFAVGDVVYRVVNQRGEPATLLYPPSGQPSISFLFDRAEAAVRGRADEVIVAFDRESGIPTRIFEDALAGTTDDELDIVVTHIEVGPRHASDLPEGVQQPGASEHVDSLFHGHGLDGTGGIHFGTPAVASFALGTKYWLGDAVPGAVFATVEPGILALRYGAGYQLYDERALGAGVAVRLAQLRGWRDALGVSRGVQYTGGDLAVSLPLTLSARAGLYQGTGADGNKLVLGTFDLGFGF